MVISDFLVSLAHGSNDVANAIGPLIVLMDIAGEPVWISFFVGAIGLALGLLLFGERVMKCIGEDLIKLDYMKGFCAQFSTAICICVGSNIGVPLSTTHCIVGSLAGVHLAGKTKFMKVAYNKNTEIELVETEPNKTEKNDQEATDRKMIEEGAKDVIPEVIPEVAIKDESSKMNVATVKKVLFWWSITLPTAFCCSAFLTWVF